MRLHDRASDSGWTDDERIEVVEAFLERAGMALQGPLYDEKCFADIDGGVGKFTLMFTLNRKTGEQAVEMEILQLEKEEYDRYIMLLRPFILMEQDVYLPKVAKHVEMLLKAEHSEHGKEMREWVASRFASKPPYFAPVHSSTYIYNVDGSENAAASSAELALAYVYGHAAKNDLDKRRTLKLFESYGFQTIAMSLNEYLQELMKLVYIVRHQIRCWNEMSWFVQSIFVEGS